MPTHPNLLPTVFALEWLARTGMKGWQQMPYENRHGVRGACVSFWHGDVHHSISVHNCSSELTPSILAKVVRGIESIDELRFGVYANKRDVPGFYATAKSINKLDGSDDHWFMIARSPERNIDEILLEKSMLSDEEQDLLSYFKSVNECKVVLKSNQLPNRVITDHIPSNRFGIRAAKLMSAPKKVRKVTSRRFQSKYFRDKEEQDIVERISNFYDEKNKAFSLLKKSIDNGFIETPDKIVSINDFFLAQQIAWEERRRSGIPHAIQYLYESVKKINGIGQTDYGIYHQGSLDEIEGNYENWIMRLHANAAGRYSEHE